MAVAAVCKNYKVFNGISASVKFQYRRVSYFQTNKIPTYEDEI